MPTYVADLEGDGLEPTKIHCFGYGTNINDVEVITDYLEMKEFLSQPDLTIVIHNGIRFDKPVLERILGQKFNFKIIDTLAISWYLFPDRNLHGLESWGEDFGTPKPKIDDWQNLSLGEYINRVKEDVKVNIQMWEKSKSFLCKLYKTEEPERLPIIGYLMFKMNCAQQQIVDKWRIDIPHVIAMQDKLATIKEEKRAIVEAVMPKVPIYKKRNKPDKPYKKDGTLSVAGAKWFNLISKQGLTKDHNEPILELVGYDEPSVTSPLQLKKWFFQLGWKPCTFKYDREEDGSFRGIPQIKVPKEPDLTPSVILLAEQEPAILELELFSIIQHRLSIFETLLECADEEGRVKAEIQGFTNTLRFKHKNPCTNLPGIDKVLGKEIRASFIPDEGMIMCGADMVSLEATTKRHYMYPHDPEYADALGAEGFDEHLDLAVHAGVLTQEQVDDHVAGRANYKSIRKIYKPVNYSAIYGVGAPKLSLEIGKTEKEARELINTYWERNWAIKVVSSEQKIVNINGQKWLLNPVNNLYYSLRTEKDIFSTLNQGTGAYCFDRWIQEVLRRHPQMNAQFHDEGIWQVPNTKVAKENMSKLLQESIDAVNASLKLNVTLKISSQFGNNYSEIH